MPELPEVQTTVNGLNAEVENATIVNVWTDYNSVFHYGKNNIKDPKYFKHFKTSVIGAKITHASRQGKNVLIHLSNHKTILIHMKMTGHFMIGNYVYKDSTWIPTATSGPLLDPYNKHIHLVFNLQKNSQQKIQHLVFSDVRKFGKVFIFDTEHIHAIEDLMHLGPDPLTKECTYSLFKQQLFKKKIGKIKLVLMDQHILSGIGNIYSDEILWAAGIHPLSIVSKLPEQKLKNLYTHTKKILKRGIDFGGDSDSDYRNIYGEPGKFQNNHNVYRKTGKHCPKKDTGVIARLKLGGRSGHYCPVHQKPYT